MQAFLGGPGELALLERDCDGPRQHVTSDAAYADFGDVAWGAPAMHGNLANSLRFRVKSTSVFDAPEC